jgi:hypothetical protein
MFWKTIRPFLITKLWAPSSTLLPGSRARHSMNGKLVLDQLEIDLVFMRDVLPQLGVELPD